MKATKKDIEKQARYIVRVPYCYAQTLLSRGESCGAAVELGSGCGVYGWNWNAYRLTNSAGIPVVVVTGYRDLFGDECREITRKYEEKARELDKAFISYTKKTAKACRLCAAFADAVTLDYEVKHTTARKIDGRELLTGWAYGVANYKLFSIATRAAESVRDFVKIEAGDDRGNAGAVFGLPYTSSGDFAGIWNTNASAKATTKTGESAYFKGVAIERTKDGKPRAVTVWEVGDVGTPYKFLTVAEVRAQFARIR